MKTAATAPARVARRPVLLEACAPALAAVVIAWFSLGLRLDRLRWPLSYHGDAIFYLFETRMLTGAGSYLHTSHLGWPVGLQMYDYPQGGDRLHLSALWALMQVARNPAVAINVYYLAGFALVALVAHLVLRHLGIRPRLAAALAVAYAVLPYHFSRGELHLFLSGYFLVPVGVAIALDLVAARDTASASRVAHRPWVVLGMVGLASTGDYYFAFTVLMVMAAAVGAAAAARQVRVLVPGAALAAGGVLVFLLNHAPSIWYWVLHGIDRTALPDRDPSTTEQCGLRIAQLFLPQPDHHLGSLAHFTRRAMVGWPPDETGQQVGVLAAAGIVVALGALAVGALAGRTGGGPGPGGGGPGGGGPGGGGPGGGGRGGDGQRGGGPGGDGQRGDGQRGDGRGGGGQRGDGPGGDGHGRLVGLGYLAGVCLLTGTIGGGSYLVAAGGIGAIRCWNRISVVLAFIGLAALGLGLQRSLGARPTTPPRGRWLTGIVAVAILAVALVDQTPRQRPDYATIARTVTSDRAFFAAVAARLPAGAKVFELPYVEFPDGPGPNGTGSYDLAKGYLYEPGLDWSFGVVRGRPDGAIPRLARTPAEQLPRALAVAEYQGLVIDRQGVGDQFGPLETALEHSLSPPVTSRDGRYVFHPIPATLAPPAAAEQDGGVALAAAGAATPVAAAGPDAAPPAPVEAPGAACPGTTA